MASKRHASVIDKQAVLLAPDHCFPKPSQDFSQWLRILTWQDTALGSASRYSGVTAPASYTGLLY